VTRKRPAQERRLRRGVPVEPVGPTGEAPRLFHGSWEEWATLSETERRHAVLNMGEDELSKVAVYPEWQSPAEMTEEIGNWTADDLRAHSRFLEQLARYREEIADYFDHVVALLDENEVESPSDLPVEPRARLDAETEALFGTPNPIMAVR
jgi:hypothetical protein